MVTVLWQSLTQWQSGCLEFEAGELYIIIIRYHKYTVYRHMQKIHQNFFGGDERKTVSQEALIPSMA
jgi:hypothetical protein